ncbi:MAG: thioredoxin domain-containing protein [Gemmatimonadota bacterium]|nr:thioredoxin domain-containing protein [Gemmatimonadota bacterium]
MIPRRQSFVVEYGDFACGACAQFVAGAWPEIREKFIETGKVRWKTVPFELGFPNSGEGAHAGECAAAQGMFWEMHDALYEQREMWVGERDPEDELVDLAGTTGLDEALFRKCYQDEHYEDRIDAANDAADTDGVRGTPTFYINGFQVQGALPIDAFRTLLEDASPRR